MDGPESPAFTVWEGAPPGTEQAFKELVELTQSQPAEMPTVFDSLGLDADALTARRNDVSDMSLTGRTRRLVGTILYESFDLEVDFNPAVDNALRRELQQHRDLSVSARRIRRLGLFVGGVASTASTQTQPQDRAA